MGPFVVSSPVAVSVGLGTMLGRGKGVPWLAHPVTVVYIGYGLVTVTKVGSTRIVVVMNL